MLKKSFLILFISFGVFTSRSQSLDVFNFGVQGGLNYNITSSIVNMGDDIKKIYSGKENSIGWNLGIYTKFSIPAVGIFIEPQLVYMRYSSEYKFNNEKNIITTNRLNIPILVGSELLGIIRFTLGPVFSYDFSNEVKWNDFKKVDFQSWKLGIRAGIGVAISNFNFDIYFDKKISDLELKIIQNLTDKPIKIDDRTAQFILSVAYSLY